MAAWFKLTSKSVLIARFSINSRAFQLEAAPRAWPGAERPLRPPKYSVAAGGAMQEGRRMLYSPPGPGEGRVALVQIGGSGA